MTNSSYLKYAIASLAALVVTLIEVPTAHTALMQPMSGNHRAVAESIPALDVTTNFAVFDRSGGRGGDTFGTGFIGRSFYGFDDYFVTGNRKVGLDTSAKYLYLYQMTNDGPGTGDMLTFAVKTPRGSVTSFGQWNLTLYDDRGSLSYDNAFGSDSASHTSAAPANIGVKNPSIRTLFSSSVGGDTSLSDDGWFNVDYDLQRGKTSRIFGFTSNIAPKMWAISLKDSPDNRACGAVPGPIAPEPTTTTLVAVATAALLAVRRRT